LDGGPAAAPALADVLTALSEHMDSLTPYHQDDLSEGHKALQHCLGRYQQSQGDLNALIQGLERFEAELGKDNVDLDQLRDEIAGRMEPLRLDLYVAQKLESILTDRVAKWQEVDTARAEVLEDLLVEVRDKVHELGDQLALYVQGYLSIDSIETNAKELARGFEKVRTSTLIALRTAVEVGRALVDPKFSLDHIPALSAVELSALPAPAAGSEGGPGSTGYELSRLYAAFDDVIATIAELDYWRGPSSSAMSSLANSLQSRIAH
jgi:hypothetical protein